MTTDPQLYPPGAVPGRFLTASIILCSRAIREAETNSMTIMGAFNQLKTRVVVGPDAPADILAETAGLGVPPGHIYIRFLTNGPRDINWTLYSRVLSWNGCTQPSDAVAPVAHGETQIKEVNKGMGELVIPLLGGGFTLTPERRAMITPGVPLAIQTRYELWCGSDFLVAHTLDIQYNFGKETADAHAAVQPPAGSP